MTNLIHWLCRWRFTCWLWTYRWPGAPLTAVLILTIAQHYIPPGEHSWVDKGLLIEVVFALLVLLVVLILGTPRPWNERTTGVLLFVLGDLTLYGVLVLPGQFGIGVPFPDISAAFLRANLAVGAPVLILGYSDWFLERWHAHKDVP